MAPPPFGQQAVSRRLLIVGALGFLFLSIDESARIHEKITVVAHAPVRLAAHRGAGWLELIGVSTILYGTLLLHLRLAGLDEEPTANRPPPR